MEGFYVEEDAEKELENYGSTSIKVAIKVENSTKENLKVFIINK